MNPISEKPFLDIVDVTTEYERVTIHYKCEVSKQSPKVHHIEWSKNDQQLDNNSKKYVGGCVHDNCFTIKSPSSEDRGNYSCKVTNAVGSVSKNVMLGNVNLN